MSGAVIATAAIATAVAVESVATVGLTVATAFAVTAAVGATVSAVGVLTHDKTLTMVGGAIGAVGAIGGLASSVGLFAGEALGSQAGSALAETAAGTTAAETASPFGAAASGTDAGTWAGAAAGAAPSAEGATISKIADGISGAVEQPASATAPVATAAESPTVAPAAATDTGATSSPAGIDNPQQAANLIPNASGQGGDTVGMINNVPAAPAAPAPAAPSVPAAGPNASTTTDILRGGQGISGAPAPATTVSGAPMTSAQQDLLINAGSGSNAAGTTIAKTGSDLVKSPFSQIMDLIKTPGGGTLLSGAIQAGGAFIGGATSSLTPAQVKALEAQAEANHAAANLSQRQLANMGQPIPVARRNGLINSTVGAPT